MGRADKTAAEAPETQAIADHPQKQPLNDPKSVSGPVSADASRNVLARRRIVDDVDASPYMVAQRRRVQALSRSPVQVAQRASLTALFGPKARIPDSSAPDTTAQPNQTGMPDRLKAGIESLSGIDMSDVRVHENSPLPAQLNAFAFAQGKNIHLGPGQERHLPHEAWHVVQQAQGRVPATRQLHAGGAVNDNPGLEREADQMGRLALQASAQQRPSSVSEAAADGRGLSPIHQGPRPVAVVQRVSALCAWVIKKLIPASFASEPDWPDGLLALVVKTQRYLTIEEEEEPPEGLAGHVLIYLFSQMLDNEDDPSFALRMLQTMEATLIEEETAGRFEQTSINRLLRLVQRIHADVSNKRRRDSLSEESVESSRKPTKKPKARRSSNTRSRPPKSRVQGTRKPANKKGKSFGEDETPTTYHVSNDVVPNGKEKQKGTGIVINVPTPARGKDLDPLALAQLYAAQARNHAEDLQNRLCMVVGLNRKWSDNQEEREAQAVEMIRIANQVREFKAFAVTVFVFFLDTDTSEFQSQVRDAILHHPATGRYVTALQECNERVYVEITDPDNTRLKLDPKNTDEPGRHERVDALVAAAGDIPPLLIGAPYWGRTPHELGHFGVTSDNRTREAMAAVSPILPYISEQSIFLEANAAMAKDVSFGQGRDEYPHIRESIRESQHLSKDTFPQRVIYDPGMFVDTDMNRFGHNLTKAGKWTTDVRSLLHNTLLQTHSGWRTFLKRLTQAYGMKMDQGSLLHVASTFGLPIARFGGDKDSPESYVRHARDPLGTATWLQEQLHAAERYHYADEDFAKALGTETPGARWKALCEKLGEILQARTGKGTRLASRGLLSEVDHRIELARKRGAPVVPKELAELDPDEVNKLLAALVETPTLLVDGRVNIAALLATLEKRSPPLLAAVAEFFINYNALASDKSEGDRNTRVSDRLKARLHAQQPWIDDEDPREQWSAEASDVIRLALEALKSGDERGSLEKVVSTLAATIASGEAQSDVLRYYFDVLESQASPFWENRIPLGAQSSPTTATVEDEEHLPDIQEDVSGEQIAAIKKLVVRDPNRAKKERQEKAKQERLEKRVKERAKKALASGKKRTPRKSSTPRPKKVKPIPKKEAITKKHGVKRPVIRLGEEAKAVRKIHGPAGDTMLLALIRARGLKVTPDELRAQLQQEYIKAGQSKDLDESIRTQIIKEIRLHWLGVTQTAVQRRGQGKSDVTTRAVMAPDIELPGLAQPLQLSFLRCLAADDPPSAFEKYVESPDAILDYVNGVGKPGQWITSTDILMLSHLLDVQIQVHSKLQGRNKKDYSIFTEKFGSDRSKHRVDVLNQHDHFDLLENKSDQRRHAAAFEPIPSLSAGGSRRVDASLYQGDSDKAREKEDSSDDEMILLPSRGKARPGSGLPNIGNSCYIAATMQAIAATPAYSAAFAPAEMPTNPVHARLIELGAQMIRKIQLQFGDEQPAERVTGTEVRDFRAQLILCGWLGGSREHEARQQDAGELFNFILATVGSANTVGLDHAYEDRGFANRSVDNVRNHMVYLTGIRMEGSHSTMEDLLGANLGRTTTEQRAGDIVREHTYTLTELPATLTIQLGRFNFSTLLGRRFKLGERIRTGRVITIPANLAPGNAAVVYDLTALVSHVGTSAEAGHYIAHVKRNGQWFEVDDRDITAVADASIDTAAQRGYLYTYTRRD